MLFGDAMPVFQFSEEFDNKIVDKLRSGIHHRKLIKTRSNHYCWFCKRVITTGSFVAQFTILIDHRRGYEARVYACYGEQEARCNYLAALNDEEIPDDSEEFPFYT